MTLKNIVGILSWWKHDISTINCNIYWNFHQCTVHKKFETCLWCGCLLPFFGRAMCDRTFAQFYTFFWQKWPHMATHGHTWTKLLFYCHFLKLLKLVDAILPSKPLRCCTLPKCSIKIKKKNENCKTCVFTWILGKIHTCVRCACGRNVRACDAKISRNWHSGKWVNSGQIFFWYILLWTTFGRQQNSDFQSQFSMSKIIRIFLNLFFIEEYQLRGTYLVIGIFW